MRIKLPNNWRPRPYQLPVWNYLENGGKHAELVWHRRSGKDEVGLHRTACSAFERVAGYWYMLPEYSQARKAIWDAINPHTGKKRIDEAFPLELRKATRNQEMMIEFKNNSSFQVVGSDNPNSLVGSAPAGIVYSEWALSNPASRAYLRPILAENNGWQIFNTTSRGRNHAYKTLQAAKNDPLAFAQVLTARQTDVFTEEQLEAELQSYINDFGEEYGTSKFEQEYLCSFDAANLGAILARSIGKLEQAGRIGPHVEYDTLGAGIEISADIGRRDAATWYFWQPKIGGYSIIDYDGGWGLDAEQWADRLAEKISNGGYKLTKIWLPHDARAKTFAAKHSAVEIFIKKFGADKIAITPDSKKSDRVNAARTIIKHCEFSDKCEQGLEGLIAWSYEYNEENKIFSSEPKHDWASHDGDGFSYGCLIMQMTKPPIKIDETLRAISVGESGVINVSLDELWTDKQQSRRY
jgi:phage terminase large subunit